MPEGPEIRRSADRIAKVLVGQSLAGAWFAFPELTRFEKRLAGACVNAVTARGKAMLTQFDNGLTLYSHNQLYGRWYVARRDSPPRTRRSLRVALHTATHSALLYSASEVEVLTARQLERHPFLSGIGPDVLDEELQPEAIAARLDDTRFRRRTLGALYLDQKFLAGVGNYLRSEILYTAGLHPALRPIDLTLARRARLGRQTIAISRRSYRTRGITLPRGLARTLKANGLSYEKHRFWVFGREGLPCHQCGGTIERLAVSGRGLFLCPACQPAPADIGS